EDLSRRLAARSHELRQGRRVERARLDAVHAESGQPRAHLTRGLVRERDREDLVRAESPRRDLPRDPPGDRGRLPRAGACEDADRPPDGVGRARLLRFETLENVPRATLARWSDGPSSVSVPKACLLRPRRPGAALRAGAGLASSPTGASRPRACHTRARAAPARPRP